MIIIGVLLCCKRKVVLIHAQEKNSLIYLTFRDAQRKRKRNQKRRSSKREHKRKRNGGQQKRGQGGRERKKQICDIVACTSSWRIAVLGENKNIKITSRKLKAKTSASGLVLVLRFPISFHLPLLGNERHTSKRMNWNESDGLSLPTFF